jgi:hypothetical protein
MKVLVGVGLFLVAVVVFIVRLLILATAAVVWLVRQLTERHRKQLLRRSAMQADSEAQRGAWEAQLPAWDAYLDDLLDYLAHHPKAEGLAARSTAAISPSGQTTTSS